MFTTVSFKDRDRILFERFTEKYLNDPNINGSTLNPKVLHFVIYYAFFLRLMEVLFLVDIKRTCCWGLYALKMKNSTILADIFKIERLKDFIRENGITDIDYSLYHFY